MNRRRHARHALSAFAALGLLDCAQAQSLPGATPAVAVSPGFGAAQAVLGLILVIALIYAAAWLMRRIGPGAASTGPVRVIGGTSVGTRERVVVVRFDDQILLLGVTAQQVNLLHRQDAPVVPDQPDAPAAPTRFLERLNAASRQILAGSRHD